jgi:hypothetical protein
MCPPGSLGTQQDFLKFSARGGVKELAVHSQTLPIMS